MDAYSKIVAIPVCVLGSHAWVMYSRRYIGPLIYISNTRSHSNDFCKHRSLFHSLSLIGPKLNHLSEQSFPKSNVCAISLYLFELLN